MAREIAITLYLFVFRTLFSLCKLLPLKRKITFILSFSENALFIYEELQRQHHSPRPSCVFLCEKRIYQGLKKHLPNESVLVFNKSSILLTTYHLATSRIILVDNYVGELAAVTFKEKVKCIQVWHAAGSFKKFGLANVSNHTRTKRALRRFQRVYDRFDIVIVGSDQMGKIFSEFFGIHSKERFAFTGIPRTDFFFQPDRMADVRKAFLEKNNQLQGKRVLLYAPTYRPNAQSSRQLSLDVDSCYKELGDDYVLLIKQHPSIQSERRYEREYPGFVYDYSHEEVNDLLTITDVLITDYSSLPFEFALLKKPMIFLAYDLHTYASKQGIIDHYIEELPGPLATTTEQVISFIKNNRFDMKKVEEFADKWNRYSRGHSSRRVVDLLMEEFR